MKLLLLGLALAALPDPLWAGYSTTGDSLVSGQETIIGTATIKGNALSVGGSTFSVLAGTVNVGGLLRVGAAGIQWSDNSVSVTAGGAGNAVLSATQTFSGANTFTSSVTVSGAGGIGVTYGVTAGSVTATANVTVSKAGNATINKTNSHYLLTDTSGSNSLCSVLGYGYSTGNTYTPAYSGYCTSNSANQTSGDLVWGARNVQTDSAPTELMRLTSGGNVGIGITAPAVKLDIVQSNSYANVGASTATHVHLWDNAGAASSFGSIGFGYSTVHMPGAFGWTTVDAAGYTAGDFFWRNRSVTTDTRPEEVMRLTSSGRLGVGTASPGTTLDVSGGATVRGQETITSSLTVVGAASIGGTLTMPSGQIIITPSDEINSMYSGSASQGITAAAGELISISKVNDRSAGLTVETTGGSVGIGTTSPGARLDVSGESGGYVQKWSTGTAASQALGEITYGNAPSRMMLRAGSGKGLHLGANESNYVYIHTDGKTGIGLDIGVLPSTTLDVNGSAQFGSGATKSTFSTTGALSMPVGASLTVQGNAFSVGGSTFTVLAGTVNVGGLLRVGAAGIQWSDNSVSVTAGGAGNAVLSATQTFSGANTFTSSVTITGTVLAGPNSYSSTAALSGAFINAWNTVSISSFQNVSEIFLYGMASSTTYRGSCALYKKTAGDIFVQLNGDTAGNYYYSGPLCPSSGAVHPSLRHVGDRRSPDGLCQPGAEWDRDLDSVHGDLIRLWSPEKDLVPCDGRLG